MKGSWSFLHEWVIYDYLMVRYEEQNLRLKLKIKSGTLIRKELWCQVTQLEPIFNTLFPDIKGLKIKGSKEARPAEVKFTTSLFKYHISSQHISQFNEFKSKNGIILVLSHDYLPQKLIEYKLDVFEIDKYDFINFCRENFIRLLNRQIKLSDSQKYWIMYQGPNFNMGADGIKPARMNGVWCPTENLTGFDLGIGDKILFIKTRGASTQDVQRIYLDEGRIFNTWVLEELWIGEISSTIYSREEYCQLKGVDYETKLWVNDLKRGNKWRWNRVFEFKYINQFNEPIMMKDIFNNIRTRGFVQAVLEAFCYRKSREVSSDEYQSLLELIINK